jgi:hypothetical protein
MIQQLGPPTFFIIFTSIERLWDPLIKALYTIHASRLNIPNKIKNLQFVHITELIQIDLVTCARYYNHITSCLHKLIAKKNLFLGIFLIFFVTKFLNCGSKHDHVLLWIKNAPMYRVHTNEEIKWFIDMYISCDVSLLPNPLQNAQQHQYTHTCKKTKPCL